MWRKAIYRNLLFFLTMEQFTSFFNSANIINYLCNQRVKIARTRNQKHILHQITKSEQYNYHVNDIKFGDEFDLKFTNALSELLPPRKSWVKIGESSRKYKLNNVCIPSNKKNLISLIRTIKRDKAKNPELGYLIKLDAFISRVQKRISAPSFQLTKPKIYPKPKNKIKIHNENNCRPISLFNLEDRLILSLTNKFLTRLFDGYFQDASFAFRSKKDETTNSILSHHDCIEAILKYQKDKKFKKLWVAECDIQKFFDTVNHEKVIELFNSLIHIINKDNPDIDLTFPQKIFLEYLKCYSFNQSVLPLNKDDKYWKEYRIPNGKFGWVNKEIGKLYKDHLDHQIGVPQGGALSGLIANIVLDLADRELSEQEVFYIRFCDDMIIISPNFRKCRKAKFQYLRAMKTLKLFPHSFNKYYVSTKPSQDRITDKRLFWKSKSKGPYKWQSNKKGAFKWIGFVGYEIASNGDVRIRKRSFEKELSKQNELEKKYLKAVQKNRRKSPGTITQSLIHKLIGMSVGRINLSNYSTSPNDLCWKNGFRKLNLNSDSKIQIKKLDRNRNRVINRFKCKLKIITKDDIKVKAKERQIIKFNKPFSYFYHLFERSE